MGNIDLNAIANWLGLLLSAALIIYGVVGLRTGSVTASSYAFLNKSKKISGPKATILSISWIVVGLVGTLAFGGYLLGIKELKPLHDIVWQIGS